MNNLFFGFFAVLCLAYFGLGEYNKGKDCRDWPSVQGVIEASATDSRYSQQFVVTHVHQVCKTKSFFSTRNSSSRRYKRWHYDFKVSYRYFVDGQRYIGSRYCFGNDDSSTSSYNIDALVAKYPRNKEVIVYYNPKKPAESTLLKGYN